MNYTEIKILTLNLHTYQENKNLWDLQFNAADVITKRLKVNYNLNYNYYWDWSHIGFDIWEEGSAVLTKHNILKTESRYISSDKSKYNFQSRNIVKSVININDLGNVELYSVHFGWDNDKINQIENLMKWQNEIKEENIIATIIAGDFNNYPKTECLIKQ